MWFQVGIYCEKCQLDQIQDGRPAATLDFNMFTNAASSWQVQLFHHDVLISLFLVRVYGL